MCITSSLLVVAEGFDECIRHSTALHLKLLVLMNPECMGPEVNRKLLLMRMTSKVLVMRTLHWRQRCMRITSSLLGMLLLYLSTVVVA